MANYISIGMNLVFISIFRGVLNGCRMAFANKSDGIMFSFYFVLNRFGGAMLKCGASGETNTYAKYMNLKGTTIITGLVLQPPLPTPPPSLFEYCNK